MAISARELPGHLANTTGNIAGAIAGGREVSHFDGEWVSGISYWSDYVTVIDIDWPGDDTLPLAG
ncbi:MAG TPA: hypothetical protein VFN61_14235 [Acidimicrobiales bacterium]|nr:hypothetical protein [Acidimicrobiales bacterium]